MNRTTKKTPNLSELDNNNEAEIFYLSKEQASLLHKLSNAIVDLGGPQASGAKSMACAAANELKFSFTQVQHQLINAYAEGLISLLIFEGMQIITDASAPEVLPDLASLEGRHDVLCLAARNQILLKLVDNNAFAYDMDNEGKLVRLVANFKGGGLTKIDAEPEAKELSSHSGLALGPHTEAPYWCAVNTQNGRSPSPSSLILSALWNPGLESTAVIPLPPILEKLGVINCLALTTGNFQFTRSDSFVSGKGESGQNFSILEFDERLGFSARFNSYRFSVNDNTTELVKNAYNAFSQSISKASAIEYCLTQTSAIIINNIRALHCRDIVKDNRRVLVRLFGLSKFSSAHTISDDPLLIRG